MQERERRRRWTRVESMMERPKFSTNNIDGVGELGMGFMLLVFCAAGVVADQLAAKCHLASNVCVRSVWVRADGRWCIHYGSKAIKTHITYPRTGFVEYRKRKARWWSAFDRCGGVTALVAAGLAFAARSHWGIGGPHWGMTTPVALIGLVFVVFYILRYRQGGALGNGPWLRPWRSAPSRLPCFRRAWSEQ